LLDWQSRNAMSPSTTVQHQSPTWFQPCDHSAKMLEAREQSRKMSTSQSGAIPAT
jgi:hypothetical protein